MDDKYCYHPQKSGSEIPRKSGTKFDLIALPDIRKFIVKVCESGVIVIAPRCKRFRTVRISDNFSSVPKSVKVCVGIQPHQLVIILKN